MRNIRREARWAALDRLQQIHDSGVLHRLAKGQALLFSTTRQDYGSDIMDDYDSDEEEDGSRSRQPHLLWGDFGAAQIIPHLTRHSPEAQDEAMLAALWLEVPEWAHARLLRPALQPILAVWPAKLLSLPALLPAYSTEQVQLGQLVSGGDDPVDRDEDERRLIRHGRLVGQPAVFKLFTIRGPADVLVAAKEIRAYQNLERLQGSCVPRVLGAGSLDRGRTAFIALEDAGMNARDLLQCSSPSRRKTVFVPKERKAVLKALSRIHDAGVLHDRIQMDHIMIQRKQGGGRPGHVMWLGLDSAVLAVGLSRRSAAARTELRDAEDLLDAIEEAFNDRLQQEGQHFKPGAPRHVSSDSKRRAEGAVAA